jgi:type IV pilus assembly protein PilN
MIKINLIGEKGKTKTRARTSSSDGASSALGGRNLLLAGILIIGVAVAGTWWWNLSGDLADWKQKHVEADRELERLAEIRKKGEEYKAQKELLARKIQLITDLKKRQELPVHILDQVSRNLPDFVWLNQMTATQSQITITGKATTYNAVTKFYNNLSRSGLFQGVTLGRTFESADGVTFSLTCGFAANIVLGEDEDDVDES